MAKPSGYVLKQQAARKASSDMAEMTMKQFMIDTLMVTMHTRKGWAGKRLQELAFDWGKVFNDHYNACIAEHPEADYLRDQLDRALQEAYRGSEIPFEPFEERYPCLQKVTYKGRKK